MESDLAGTNAQEVLHPLDGHQLADQLWQLEQRLPHNLQRNLTRHKCVVQPDLLTGGQHRQSWPPSAPPRTFSKPLDGHRIAELSDSAAVE